jgi:hypothetical protein
VFYRFSSLLIEVSFLKKIQKEPFSPNNPLDMFKTNEKESLENISSYIDGLDSSCRTMNRSSLTTCEMYF